MKKLRCSRSAKAIAVILLCALALCFVSSALCIFWGDELGVFTGNYDVVYNNCLRNRGESLLHNVYAQYFYNNYGSAHTEANFSYTVYSDGEQMYSTYDGKPYYWMGIMADDTFGYVANSAFSNNAAAVTSLQKVIDEYIEKGVNVAVGYIPMELSKNSNIMTELNIMTLVYNLRYVSIIAAGVSLLLGILLFVYLMYSAGVKNAEGEVKAGFFDRIPYDLYTLVLGTAFFGCLFGGMFTTIDEMRYTLNYVLTLTSAALFFLGAGLILLAWLMSTAVRVKLRTLFKNTVCYKLLSWLFGKLRGGKGILVKVLLKLPMLWRYVVILAALVFIDFVAVSYRSYNGGHAQRMWLLRTVIYVPAALYVILYFKRLRDGTKAIASGDENTVISTKYLYGEMKAEAEDLNNIRAGLSKAVDERMKSEMFKTELITNVSHDIKTPLTSIINYADLLAKEEPENEKMREYIEVISRQSDKLKKLIEDLIEASKASTGALRVDLVRTELGVLIEQTEGEYAEKLEKAGLQLRITKPEKPLYIMVDSRHIWRIFDNLMNNIVKYAQPGTRVYISAAEENGDAVVVFRNISQAALNVPAEKLMERFVRGDASRHSNGNGLGLSIASSLASLQGGDMQLSVDGDLFKVTLRFKKAE